MKKFDLSAKTALVTGSTQGIGRGIAESLRENGARVLFHGHQPVGDLPSGEVYLNVDLSQAEAPRELIENAFAHAPELDILVCNAGSFFDTPFLQMTDEAWEENMSLNVRAPYFLIQEFARRLTAQGREGSVVIIGSTNGFFPEYDSTAYDTAKGALVMMTRTVALALAEYNIRVNSVAPGLIRTPLTERWLDSNHALRAHYENTIPLGRIGAPTDIGNAVAFLNSDAASYITGQILIVDGGLTLPQIGKLSTQME